MWINDGIMNFTFRKKYVFYMQVKYFDSSSQNIKKITYNDDKIIFKKPKKLLTINIVMYYI